MFSIMKYILSKNVVIRREKFDKVHIYIYSSCTRKLSEISLPAKKVLVRFIKPFNIDEILNDKSLAGDARLGVSKFLDKMIRDKYLEKYE